MAFGRPTTTFSTARPVTPARITTEAVRRAYRTARKGFGLVPIRGRWVDGGIGCDALAALVAERTGREPKAPSGLIEVAKILELSLDYVRGFMIGWDFRPAVRLSLRSAKAGSVTYLGWQDGWDIAMAMGLNGPEKEWRGECLGR